MRNASTASGGSDDAAVIAAGADEVTLCTTDLLLEGVDFDLTYFPLKHLGYKAVVVAVSDLLAMNGRPEQLLVSLGVSSKISVEAWTTCMRGFDSLARRWRSIWSAAIRRLR